MVDDALDPSTYYRNREQAERGLAERSVSDTIRQIHLSMAERYRELAEELKSPSRSKATVATARPSRDQSRLSNARQTVLR
jgi:hypothetical protein